MGQTMILTRTVLNLESSTIPEFIPSFFIGKCELFSATKKNELKS